MPITLDGTNGITTPTYGGADTSEYIVPVTQFKNRIINGAMAISQRGTSPTITGNGEYSVDRYLNYYSGNAFTSVQSTTAPAGFNNSLLLTVTTASASPSYSFFGQRIEGFNVADLNWGTANAKTVTLSFWVRSSVTGIYSLAFGNADADRAYPVTYTISSANTWEYKTVTVAGDTTGTWNTTNGIGINLRFNMGTATAGRLGTSGSWQAGNLDGATGSTGANTWANTNGATFYITGVQLEVGSTATSFDYRPYGTELQLCQRYYYKVFPASAGIMLSTGWGASSTTNLKAAGAFAVPMRTRPTALEQNGTANNYQVVVAGTATTCSAVPTFDGATSAYYWIANGIVSSGLTAGQAGYLRTDGTNGATAYLAWSAEL